VRLPAPASADEVADQVVWRLWRQQRRPVQEFAIGDEVWLRHGSGRSALISWRVRVDALVSERCRSAEDAADVLEHTLGLPREEFLENGYTADKTWPCYVLAFTADPTEQIGLSWPTALGDMPRDGVLALDAVGDVQLRALGMLSAHDAAAFNGRSVDRRRGAGRMLDPVLRRAIEDYAQEALMRRYVQDGYEVRDTRSTRPYDAIATRGDRTLFLEAKGTQSARVQVDVTAGEVRHVQNHPSQCVLGVVTEIVIEADGTLNGGVLHLFEPWTVEDETLTALTYRHSPSPTPGQPVIVETL
jgi:hypothetical protein